MIQTTKREKAETARSNKPKLEEDKIMERARKIVEPQTARSTSSNSKYFLDPVFVTDK